jgi:hypothetical protein
MKSNTRQGENGSRIGWRRIICVEKYKFGQQTSSCSYYGKIMNMKQVFDRTKPFNHLPHLPPPEEIIDKDVLLQWGYASRNLAELNRNLLRLPDPLMLYNTISIREAKSSSEIENIFTTDDELYKAISDS